MFEKYYAQIDNLLDSIKLDDSITTEQKAILFNYLNVESDSYKKFINKVKQYSFICSVWHGLLL